ncbi:exodeoxyribonuclease I [Halioxenophilus sp. WMMB6]|uniref:exodeoxyribonuclease I n=1 Tax=Halioxenophilus sp. WMMB6 TaxID=3073815 RepID=UPI00295EF551|nr:exodeoxyribonuclease I [Halioxenophilus sp. WMMB6]
MNSFYWHDYETWGANPSVDRPVQFAGVRTDENLNIIGEPLNILCRPCNDFLPQPEACLITGITPQEALAKGMPEREFIAKIYAELSRPGTCGVGYNSIRFDDEVTRHTLWRNFYEPYEREWKNGNSRWDIIDMVRLTYALRPEGIEWPMVNGVPSFKLESLAAANNLNHDHAHDALSDVYATIALARLIKEQQPRLFDYLYQLRDKRKVAELIDIPNSRPLLHVSSMFPAARGCAALIVPLMMHPRNKNSVICYDLSADPAELLNLPADTLRERLYTRSADLPEGVERVALKEVHLNKSPVLATTRLLEPAAAKRLGIDLELCQHHWQQLKGHTLAPKLQNIYVEREFDRPRDEESALYDGFLSHSDKAKVEQVHRADGDQIAKMALQFEDRRLAPLLFRYRARNFPETLSTIELEQWQEYRYRNLMESKQGSMTLESLHEKIFELQESGALTASQMQILESLSDYADAII